MEISRCAQATGTRPAPTPCDVRPGGATEPMETAFAHHPRPHRIRQHSAATPRALTTHSGIRAPYPTNIPGMAAILAPPTSNPTTVPATRAMEPPAATRVRIRLFPVACSHRLISIVPPCRDHRHRPR